MEFISYRQSVYLLSMILPVTGHFLLLPTIIILSGHEAWVAILLALPIGLLFGFTLSRLHTIYPTYSFDKMLIKTFGKITGNLLMIILMGYFFYLLLITFYGLVDFIKLFFLPETPLWVLAIPFYLVVFYAIKVGVESITRISEALLPIIIFTGSAVGIATLHEKDYELLFPIFENGIAPMYGGILLTIALFGEMSMILMIHLKKGVEKSKSIFFTNTLIVLFMTFMFLGTVTGVLAIFGEEFSKNLVYPAQGIIRLVSFGFIERFDIFGITVMVFGSIIRASILHISIYQGVRNILPNERAKWLIHLAIGLSVIIYSFTNIHNHHHYIGTYLTKYYPLTAVISISIPVITWVLSECKLFLNKTY